MTTTPHGTIPLEAVDRALGIRGYLRGPWRVLDETYANGSELIRVIPPVGGFRLAATGVTLEDDGPLRFGRADVYVLDDADWLEEDRIAPTVTEAAKIFDDEAAGCRFHDPPELNCYRCHLAARDDEDDR